MKEFGKVSNDEEEEPNAIRMRLPSDSESIRSNIVDSEFTCDDRQPGYYADIDNDCQIFHRCVEDPKAIYSFICPEQTIFNQKVLVCVWNNSMDFDCEDSDDYYDESNQAFSGNSTAESNISDNMMNAMEININSAEHEKSGVEVEDVEAVEDTRRHVMAQNIKHYEIPAVHDVLVIDEVSKVVEENAIEEELEDTIIEEELKEFTEVDVKTTEAYNDIESIKSIDVETQSNKLTLQDAIEQQTTVFTDVTDLTESDVTDYIYTTTEMSRNLRRRSKSHQKRFLFEADVE